MTLAGSWPKLDGSDLLLDTDFPASVQRTSTAVATSTVGANSGVAPLDSAARIPYANAVPGWMGEVRWNGSWPGSRPSARTDIGFVLVAPTGTTAPAWMIDYDIIKYRDTGGIIDPNAMPTANYTDANGISWVHVYGEDFLTPIPLGEIYPGGQPDGGALNPACAAYPVYNSSFKIKSVSNATDGNSQYDAKLTTSIHDSWFDINCHYDAATNRFVVGAIKPWLPAGAFVDENYMTYGSVSFRYRLVNPIGNVNAYRGAGVFINSNQWVSSVEGWGEFDWPERTIAGVPGGFFHPTHPIGTGDTNASVNGTGVMTEWNIFEWKWFPWNGASRTIWTNNGITCLDRTDRVPISPMKLGWQFQIGSNSLVPAQIDSVTALIDWISMWKVGP